MFARFLDSLVVHAVRFAAIVLYPRVMGLRMRHTGDRRLPNHADPISTDDKWLCEEYLIETQPVPRFRTS